jgi:hypothetical protein
MSEDYTGPAVMHVDGDRRAVTVRLSARFEPIDGRTRWAGRTGPDAGLQDLVRAGRREVTVAIAGGEPVPARIGDPDPWGGVRLTGTGRPPWIPTGGGTPV